MRRAAFALGTIPFLASALFACEEDSGGVGGPALGLDAGSPAFDSGQQPFDAGTADVAPDASAPPPSVTVTVTGKKGPTANVRVVFHDAAGAVLETKVTGADGKATSTGTLPAMASALFDTGYRRQIVTWTGLENGDDLTMRDVEAETEATPVGEYSVTFPTPAPTGSSRYGFYAGSCTRNDNDGTERIYLDDHCASSPTSVLVAAYSRGGTVLGHSFKKGNALPTDNAVHDLTTGAWKPATAVALKATNLPANEYVEAELLEIADAYAYGPNYYDGFNYGTRSTLDDEGAASFATATDFADALQANVFLQSDDNLASTQLLIRRFAPATTVTFNAAEALPAITDAELANETDVARPEVRWVATSTASADGGIVRINFNADEMNYRWTFVVAPGSTTVKAPAMPSELASFFPAPGSEVYFGTPEILFLEADVLPSYDDFRRQQDGLVRPDSDIMDLRYNIPMMTINGTYRATLYAPLPR